MRSEYDCCERVHAHGELSCCTDQIVRAIRDHTRAMVAAQRWTLLCSQYPDKREDVLGERAIIETDALLAALSASSGGTHAASGEEEVPEVITRAQDVGGDRQPAKATGTEPSATQAATPPLSADLVTVRWADLVLYLDHSNLVERASSAWDADLFSAMQHLREAVRR